MGETVRRVASIAGFDTASQNIQALEVDGALLENCDERFQKFCHRVKLHHEVHTFQEAQGMKGTQILSLNEKVCSLLNSVSSLQIPIAFRLSKTSHLPFRLRRANVRSTRTIGR
jgi:hypothetical protein